MESLEDSQVHHNQTLEKTLRLIAHQWAKTNDNQARLECDKRADEQINEAFKSGKNYAINRLAYATFYVNEKLSFRKGARRNADRTYTQVPA
jgi:hypothetical protein